MSEITIYHNPRCRKSREGLQLLQNKNIHPVIRFYLDKPLSNSELTNLISQLKIEPIDLVRKSESIWKTDFKGKNLTPNQIIEAMVAHPKLIERPIVVNNGKAVIGRPAEKILDIL